jgi:probable addiction module antidote protein
MRFKKYFGDYHRYLIQSLKNPKEARAYLNATLEDEDPGSFLVALRNVVEAHGVSKTARLAGLNRVSLYKMFSKRGNPGISSLYVVLHALGFSLRVDSTPKAA